MTDWLYLYTPHIASSFCCPKNYFYCSAPSKGDFLSQGKVDMLCSRIIAHIATYRDQLRDPHALKELITVTSGVDTKEGLITSVERFRTNIYRNMPKPVVANQGQEKVDQFLIETIRSQIVLKHHRCQAKRLSDTLENVLMRYTQLIQEWIECSNLLSVLQDQASRGEDHLEAHGTRFLVLCQIAEMHQALLTMQEKLELKVASTFTKVQSASLQFFDMMAYVALHPLSALFCVSKSLEKVFFHRCMHSKFSRIMKNLNIVRELIEKTAIYFPAQFTQDAEREIFEKNWRVLDPDTDFTDDLMPLKEAFEQFIEKATDQIEDKEITISQEDVYDQAGYVLDKNPLFEDDDVATADSHLSLLGRVWRGEKDEFNGVNPMRSVHKDHHLEPEEIWAAFTPYMQVEQALRGVQDLNHRLEIIEAKGQLGDLIHHILRLVYSKIKRFFYKPSLCDSKYLYLAPSVAKQMRTRLKEKFTALMQELQHSAPEGVFDSINSREIGRSGSLCEQNSHRLFALNRYFNVVL